MRDGPARWARAVVVLSLAVIPAGCGGGSMSSYDWSLYDQLKEATPETFEYYIATLEEMRIEAEEEQRKPRPGLDAELGYALARKGDLDRGLRLLDEEVEHYPEAEKFVRVMKRLARGEATILEAPETPEAR